ncbi:unnamed protein product [Nyctereutes procyonoides]|uniref:(raccoon dog) hypothetical protein n=1 Tax=Nyctereutes procyonoides TaxID=34880 RepID=A0A811ZKV4_NYCPR|nr:unnamed protein product [Nyctereutes procyonoides]
MKTLVIGINSVTNGWTTILAKNLQKYLPNCSIICQGDWSKPKSEIKTEIDFYKISILIIKGFLLFNYKPFNTLWNRNYFLTIPYKECKKRSRPLFTSV